MRHDTILTAIAEWERWKQRQAHATGKDLEKVNRQVAYYAALVKDMKREVRPARLRDLLNNVGTLLRP